MADERSEPGGMKVLRLYADALGESRFETTTMPMALKEFAPPAASLYVSHPQPAQNYVILEVGAKWGGAVPHPSPARMMAFSLSGCTRVTASSGESTHSSRAIVCYTTTPPARGTALKSYRTCLLDGYLSASQIRSSTPPRCPLWVISGHLQCKTACPLYPQKRTCAVHYVDVRFVPIADIDRQFEAPVPSSDPLVSGRPG